jgi:hypothetical protein
MHGNEKGTYHKNYLSAKWKKLFIMFYRVKKSRKSVSLRHNYED